MGRENCGRYSVCRSFFVSAHIHDELHTVFQNIVVTFQSFGYTACISRASGAKWCMRKHAWKFQAVYHRSGTWMELCPLIKFISGSADHFLDLLMYSNDYVALPSFNGMSIQGEWLLNFSWHVCIINSHKEVESPVKCTTESNYRD